SARYQHNYRGHSALTAASGGSRPFRAPLSSW
ncbi:hypothetical protein WJX84_002692, partial [Apatococcus fuscideae]